jgi:hypothetical protein
MTVQELIDLLQKLPQDAHVELTNTAGCTKDIETWYWQGGYDGKNDFVFLSPKD